MKRRELFSAKIAGCSILSLALVAASMAPLKAFAVEGVGNSSSNAGASTSSYGGSASSQVACPSAKDETVYVTTGPDGAVRKEEVSVTLSNPTNASALSDSSNLFGIAIKSGAEAFSVDGADVVWNATGSSVSYKGQSNNAAPIAMKVSYELDGERISAEEIAGKTGHVTIRYEFENNSAAVSSSGVKAPFVVVTAVMLDTKLFSNLNVVNGKSLEDGSHTIVVGYSMPGFGDTVGANSVPSYFEIEADVKNFALGSALSLATPNAFGDIDTGFDASGLSSSLQKLQEAMTEAVEGSDGLAEAIGKATDGAQLIASSSGELARKTEALPTETSKLSQGANAVYSGTTDVYGTLNSLDQRLVSIIGHTSGSGEQSGLTGEVSEVSNLKSKAESLYQSLSGQSLQGQSTTGNGELSSLLQGASAEIAAYTSAIQTLNQDAAQVKSAASQSQQSIEAAQSGLSAIDLSSIPDPELRSQIQSQINAASSNIAAADSSVDNVVAAASSLQSDIVSIDSSQSAAAASALSQGGGTLSAQNVGDAVTQDQIDKAKSLAVGLARVETSLTHTTQGLSAVESQMLSQGLLSTTALPKLITYSKQTAQGADELNEQSGALSEAVSKLASGSLALATGLDVASTSSRLLVQGLQKVNDDGLTPFGQALESQLIGPLGRFEAAKQAGRDYGCFSGNVEGASNSVKFVFETEAIG